MEELFPYGKPVTGKQLIDREEVIEEICYNMRGGQSVILASPRRYGKSSVVLESLKRLKNEGYLTGYIDLFDKTSISEIAEALVECVLLNETNVAKEIIRKAKKNIAEILKNVQFKHIFENYEIILSFASKEVDEARLIDEALTFPQNYAVKKNKKFILAIDEFGELKNLNSQLIKKMRAKFQLQDRVTYIFSGSQQSLMKDLFTHKSEVFYGFGKLIGLTPLPKPDLITYLINTFKKGNFKLSKDIANLIADKTNSHPHFTKVLASSILQIVHGKTDIITKKDVEKGYSLALLRVKGELEKEWAGLSKAILQRKILKFLALEKGYIYGKGTLQGIDKSKIYISLVELEKKGIIQKVAKGKYSFINPFFPAYIKLLEEEGI
jgi:hypothetical protein